MGGDKFLNGLPPVNEKMIDWKTGVGLKILERH